MAKVEIIERINAIANLANNYNNGYHYEVKVNEWVKYGKDRTYFSIVETRDNSTHYVKRDYGYYDNNADEFVAGKASIDYTFSGAKFEEPAKDESEIIEVKATKVENTENETVKYTIEALFIGSDNWDTDAIQDYVEANSAEEAMSLARDYIRDCIIENGENPDEHGFALRAAVITNFEHGEWIYEN